MLTKMRKCNYEDIFWWNFCTLIRIILTILFQVKSKVSLFCIQRQINVNTLQLHYNVRNAIANSNSLCRGQWRCNSSIWNFCTMQFFSNEQFFNLLVGVHDANPWLKYCSLCINSFCNQSLVRKNNKHCVKG